MHRCLPRVLSLAFLILLCPLAVQAQFGFPFRHWSKPPPTPPVDWYAANGKLSAELRSADIGDLAQRALRDPMPGTAAARRRRLALLVRAEYRQDALAMLKSRPRFLDAHWNWNLNVLASEAALTYHFPELARSICERFPEQGYSAQVIDEIIRKMLPAALDAWLARQGMKEYGQWFAARLRWNSKYGTAGPLIAPLAHRVRAHPDDLPAISEYLWAIRQMPYPEDKTWVSTVCKPRLAIESLILGYQFSIAGVDPIPLYQRALQTPFQEQDAEWYEDYIKLSGPSPFDPDFRLTERQLRLWTQTALMEAYNNGGQAARAQALREELTKQNPDGLPELAQVLSGQQIQGPYAAPVFKLYYPVAAQPQANRESPKYWIERALYHSGRKEDGPAVEAFELALKLSPIPTDTTPSWRWDVVETYQRYLWERSNPNSPKEAVALLRHELTLAPPGGLYALQLLMQIDHYETNHTHFITPDDPQLWKVLAAQKEWSPFSQILSDLRKNTPVDEREQLWARLEDLARQGSVSCASTLGQTELAWDAAQRAIPLLEQALLHTQDKQQQWGLLAELWEAGGRANDWRDMEVTLPRLAAVVGPTFSSIDKWREIAVAAARSGAPQGAMRFFRMWVNQDRRSIARFVQDAYNIESEMQTYLQLLKTAEPRCSILSQIPNDSSGGFPGGHGRYAGPGSG